MDLEEWEVLPDDGFLEIHDDGDNKIFSRKHFSESNTVFHMNYFICPAPNPSNHHHHHNQFVDSKKIQLIEPRSIQKTPDDDDDDHEVTKEVIISKVPFEINMLPSTICEKIRAPDPAAMVETEYQDQVLSQVFFFKKMKESESRLSQDMIKINESPKSYLTQIDLDPFDQFDEKSEVFEEKNEDNNGGLKLWKWSLTGIGAICSFGVAAAAATICILFIGNHQNHNQNQHKHKLHSQIFSDDKRMKQVVNHGSKLNEAIAAVREVPITRAHITVGGYYMMASRPILQSRMVLSAAYKNIYTDG